MKHATIFFLFALAFLCACAPDDNQQQYEAPAPKVQVIEAVLFDDGMTNQIGTALLPKWWAHEYRHIEFFNGTYPPAGTDFDVMTARLKEGGEVFVLCIR
jgi:hypothetical protein